MMLTTTVYWLLSGSKERVEQAHPIKHFHYGMSPPRKYPVSEGFATKIRDAPYRANVALMQRSERPRAERNLRRIENLSNLAVCWRVWQQIFDHVQGKADVG